ncbi:pre-mRNA-splicing factor ISY1 [Strigomonas culicis]|uniref:Pre-mRNA-splicing factor ISY1 n=1 Tax=Strigomonas culicis TaxID=28005 RepID=S9UC19_9TRYP|nr:pre-mRNA-splicing factor ISY1 [Strigomonas culicis]|eukprot:EPY28352.1 pre-mRNA-splicing factor ISY1 [Strigomonas culicis]
MQDNLKEIKGTLARASERKNTILYKHAKREREEKLLERLGVSKLPTNPVEVTDTNVIKHVIFEIKKDIGSKVAKLRNPTFYSLEKDGEKIIRQKNDEVNSLITKRVQWEKRLAFLNNEPFSHVAHKKFYFGCARQLPEGESTEQVLHESHEEEEDAEAGSDHSSLHEIEPKTADGEASASLQYAEKIKMLFSQDLDSQLMNEEKQQEAKERQRKKDNLNNGKPSPQVENLGLTLSFWNGEKLNLPDESRYKAEIIEARKKVLREKIEAARNKLL